MLWGKETHRFRTRMSVERDVRNELRALPHHDLRVSNSAASIFPPLDLSLAMCPCVQEAAFLGVDDACW